MSRALWTVKQVAGLFGVSESTIYRMLRGGDLTGFKVGKGWRITHEDIVRLVGAERAAEVLKEKPPSAGR